jgi:Ca2+/Na+ antiporter
MKRRIAASLTLLLWGSFAYNTRNTLFVPKQCQFRHFVYFPLIMMIINIGLLLLARRIPVARFVIIWLLQIFIFFLWVTAGECNKAPDIKPASLSPAANT